MSTHMNGNAMIAEREVMTIEQIRELAKLVVAEMNRDQDNGGDCLSDYQEKLDDILDELIFIEQTMEAISDKNNDSTERGQDGEDVSYRGHLRWTGTAGDSVDS